MRAAQVRPPIPQCDSNQLPLQFLRQGVKPWKIVAVHFLELRALGVNTEVKGSNRSAIELSQWHRDRSKADLGFLIGERIAICPDLEDRFAQLPLIEESDFGELLEPNAG